MEKKRGQHYVWRYYLTSWTDDSEKLVCLRNGNLFPTNPKNIAKARDFYRLRNLSQEDIAIVDKAFIEGQGNEKIQRIDRAWLNACVYPFRLKEKLEGIGQWDNEKETKHDVFINNFVEDFHSDIEDKSLPYLNYLKNGNVDFLNSEEDKFKFMFFICLQYMRTNMMKNNMQKSFEASPYQYESPYPITHTVIDNVWSVIYVILARRLAIALCSTNSYRFLIVKNNSTLPFITGDQPVINTRTDYSEYTETKELELYYPITPSLALLITTSRKDNQDQFIFEVQEDEVKLYNDLIFKASHELIFANNETVLQSFKNITVAVSN